MSYFSISTKVITKGQLSRTHFNLE